MPRSRTRLLVAAMLVFLGIAGCDNPIVRNWASSVVIRVEDPTSSEHPVFRLDLPPDAGAFRYRFVSVANGERTVLVEDTDVEVSALPAVEDEEAWDRSSDPWVALGEEATVSFSYSEPLAEAVARYMLEVAVLTEGSPGEWSRRDTIVDLTPPAAPTLEDPITLTSETGSIFFSGPDIVLSHYVIQWDSGSEERVEASGDPPSGQYDIPVTVVNGDTHTLWVRAVDTAGNRSDPATSTITVDLNNGLVTFPSSDNSVQSTNEKPTWTWRAPTGASKVRYTLFDASENEKIPRTEATVDTADPTGTVQPTDPLAEGAYTLVAQAWMPATATWSDETSYTITITFCDYDAPDVTGDSPVNALRPTFWWTDIGDVPYRYQINGTNDDNWMAVGSTSTRTEMLTTYREFTLTQDLVEGAHTIYLQVQDSDGVWSAGGSFPFTIEQGRPRLISFALYDDSDQQISGINLDYVPPGSYLRLSFSETMDVGTDPTVLVQLSPAIALNAPVDVSVSPNVGTDFKITPTSDWVEGQPYTASVQTSITDMASNELDLSASTSISIDFAAALSIGTATVSTGTDPPMPDTALAGILGAMAGGGIDYVHQISTLDISGDAYNAVRASIANLTGLEQFTALRYLDLEGATGVSSAVSTTVDALSKLTKLGYLNIAGTNITDVSFLSEMPQLQVLLAGKDATVLGGGYTGISDISALSAISGLVALDLSGNSLDASAIGATTQVTDPIAAQTSLETLILSDNSSLSNADFLTGSLPNLTALLLNGCGLSSVDLTNQTVLEEATLSDNPSLSTVTGLSSTLTVANLAGSDVSDLSAIAGLTNLTTLVVSGATLTDISGLSGASNLTDLTLSSCGLADGNLTGVITFANLPNLTSLDLSGNSLIDVSASVGTLTGLTSLDLSGNAITDITTTGADGMTGLLTLDLADNAIAGLLPSTGGYWSAFGSMALLDLSGNEITDVAPLAGLPSAGSILLARNLDGIGDSTIVDGIAELSVLFAIVEAAPANPLSYLVFSGNANMLPAMTDEIDGLKADVNLPSGATILGPTEANPFE